MKISSVLFSLLAAGSLLVAVGCSSTDQSTRSVNGSTSSTASARASRTTRLQVNIVVPASMSSIRDDDVIDAFGDSVRDTLHAHGFKGRIKVLDENEPAATGTAVLEINLNEWRVDSTGNVTCTFGATLRTPAGSQSLGLFNGSSLLAPWALRGDWNARADGFVDAAHDAVANLADRIAQTGLLSKTPTG